MEKTIVSTYSTVSKQHQRKLADFLWQNQHDMCVVHDDFDPIIKHMETKICSFTSKMDLQQQAVKLSKEIEKIMTVLTDSTALSQAQRTAKENKWSILVAQLTALQNQL